MLALIHILSYSLDGPEQQMRCDFFHLFIPLRNHHFSLTVIIEESGKQYLCTKKKKSRAFVHYFACRAREEPIISVCLLSGLLWDELKCEFNLLGAKVNFRRGISRCAL